ncbi:hypothetical protein UPYG_G00164640 [Umbra pygmaea]|uniref:BHLH domain-containing protein n=1 Tax=Umbra pygmaea TaxID=75934 RepID=A0ABD0WNV4_UMBPY
MSHPESKLWLFPWSLQPWSNTPAPTPRPQPPGRAEVQHHTWQHSTSAQISGATFSAFLIALIRPLLLLKLLEEHHFFLQTTRPEAELNPHRRTRYHSAMDAFAVDIQDSDDSFLFDCEVLLEQTHDPVAYNPILDFSDLGYYSACSSLSPTSSVDSCCFSPARPGWTPATLQLSPKQDLSHVLGCGRQDALHFISPPATSTTLPNKGSMQTPLSARGASSCSPRKSRSRYPGKKRQSASDREKMRMRDLTKALHHLRTYLPPCLAPARQTLTKIEILKHTIRYISYLSEQLLPSDEMLHAQAYYSAVDQKQTVSEALIGFSTPQETTSPAFYSPKETTSPAFYSPEETTSPAFYSPEENFLPAFFNSTQLCYDSVKDSSRSSLQQSFPPEHIPPTHSHQISRDVFYSLAATQQYQPPQQHRVYSGQC